MAHSSRKKPASRAALVCALVCAFGLAACAGRPDAEGEGLEPRRSGVPQSLTAQGSVSQRFQAQTDRSLNGDNDPVFGATTRLGATAGFSTPRAGVSFNGGVSGSGFFGPGSTDGLTRIDPDAQIEAFYRVARLDFSGLLDFDIQPTSVTQVEDTGVTQEGTAQVDLRLGADLAYLGTRFIATRESMAAAAYKQMLVDCSMDDVMLTSAFIGLPASKLRPSIVAAGLDPDALPARGMINVSTDINPDKRPKRWKDTWSAGHTVSGVHAVPTVAELVDELAAEYA